MTRKKSFRAGELLVAAAALPWWTSVALAALLFIAMHQIVQPHSLAWVAYAGQFIVPALCVAAAFAVFVRRRHRRELVRAITPSRGAGLLESMEWHDFELLVGEAFRLQGYTVGEGLPGPREPGADLELHRDGEMFLLQYKHWRTETVGVAIVREFYGAVAHSGAARGFLITSGRFSDDAVAFAQDANLELIDGDALFLLLQRARDISVRRG